MAAGSCPRCGRYTSRMWKQRCHECYDYLRRTGLERPDKVIAKSAQRAESKPQRRHTNSMLVEAQSITRESYIAPELPKSCACGCNRTPDNFKNDDGLSAYCRSLQWHKIQRAVA